MLVTSGGTMTNQESQQMSNLTPKPIQIPLPIDGETIEIPLTRGYIAIIDAIDADLTQFKWHAKIVDGYKVYAARKVDKRPLKMHLVIAERILNRPLIPTDLLDHADNYSLNNCRNNLRLATVSQNTQNQKKRSNCTSPYKGVTWHKRCRKWQAAIKLNGKNYHLGLFADPLEAHEAYCKKATELFGEFARFA